MTIEQLMTAKGYSQQEITDLAPLLTNAKFRKDLEDELTNAEKATKDLNEYDRWFTNEITPQHTALLRERDDAKAEAAAAKARFETYQRASMARQAGKTEAEIAAEETERARLADAARTAEAKLDPRYVTSEIFGQTYEKVGEAIATATNIVSQHMQLFPGQFIDMEALRNEAKAAKKPVKDFWETKYNVAGKRAELVAKAKADERAQIAREEREKVIVEFGGASNPNMANVLRPSNNAFVERKKADAGKQPWERTDNDLTKSRIEKAVQAAAKRGELATA